MKKLMLVVSLLLTVNSYAAKLDAPPRRNLNPVKSPRQAEVMREARAIFALADGSLWVTHPVPAESEPSALGVTRFGTDGSAKVFLLSDWLPKGAVPNGWCGQVYGVTMLTDGRVAVSGGWTDGRDSHNAIFVLRRVADGTYSTDRKFEWAGVADIVGGPNNTILAVTSNASLRNGGPLLTLFTAGGAVIGTHAACNPPQAKLEALQNARKARLRRVGRNRFAVYEPAVDSVAIVDVEITRGGSTWSTAGHVFVGDDAHTAHLPFIGFEVSPDGNEVLVARTGPIDGRYGTQLTLYSRRGIGEVKQKTVTDMPWNFMIRQNNEVHGVVRHRDVLLDTVRFVAD